MLGADKVSGREEATEVRSRLLSWRLRLRSKRC